MIIPQIQARSKPSYNRGSFSSDFGPFSGFDNWSSQWLSIEETSIFKIIMIDDVTVWSKLESTW